MTTSSLRCTGYVFVGLLLCLTLASCDLISEEKCGPRFDAEDTGKNTSLAAWQTEVFGGNRFFRRTLKVDNVCPDEHVTASFLFVILSETGTLQLPVTIRGRIVYSLVFPDEEDTLAENLRATNIGFSAYNGEVEAGLKQTFGEDPATYFVVFEIFFPTTGVASRDLAYIMDLTDSWEMRTRYFEFPSE